jgi:hypothetical protein
VTLVDSGVFLTIFILRRRFPALRVGRRSLYRPNEEQSMKKLISQGVIAAAVCLGVCAVAHADDEGKACSARTLHGEYVFAARGYNIVVVDGVAQSQPKAIVEVIVFHGDGTLSVPAATRSVNGVVARSTPSVGSYTVNDDCTGTIAFAGPAFDIFVTPHGDGLWLIQTNPGGVFQGTATRVSRQIR